MVMKITYNEFIEIYHMLFKSPEIGLSLMLNETDGNDSFYRDVTTSYYKDANRRHKKFPVFKQLTRGVALSPLTSDFESYMQSIESSGRRNIKKAIRLNYSFRRIDYNQHLDEIWEIRKSAPVRQGKVPDILLNTKPVPNNDPKSKNNIHDYPYYGVFDRENILTAYASCLVAGQIVDLTHYYGHADHQKNGVVPMLITSIANDVINNYPNVKAYVYDGFIGASPTLKRFKKKFNFKPFHVKWSLF